MGRGRYKRLKVRLKAADPVGLARDLGAALTESGLFLASPRALNPGTAVQVRLHYADGTLAMFGEGEVLSVQISPAGLHLAMQWDPSCRPVLYWVIAHASEPSWDVHAALQSHRVEATADPGASSAPEAEPAEAAVDLAFEAPIEEDGSPSEDLLPFADGAGFELVSDRAEALDYDEQEPILLEDVVEEPPSGASTQYAFSRGARDELGPSPAPSDALISPAIVPKFNVSQVALPDREAGEVTPLARIELVRRSNSTVRAGELGPPPLEAVQRVPASAIPSKQRRPDLPAPSRRAMGMDLGDGLSRAAIVERGQVRVVPSRRGQPGVPSAVLIEPSGRTIVGEPAVRGLAWHPGSGIFGTKRLIGRLFCSPRVESLKARLPCTIGAAEEDEVALSVGEHFISLEEIEALVLKEVKEGVTLALQDQINRVVLTCPASFGLRQRRATAMSGELAGLHVERVLSAPLAVVLGQLKRGRLGQGRYLIYDLGESHFDTAVVEVKAQSARIIAAGGDPELGGVEFDHALAERVLEEVESLHGTPHTMQVGFRDVVEACEVAKCALSTQPSARVVVEHQAVGEAAAFVVEVELSREDAEARFEPLLRRTLEIVDEVLARCGVTVDGLDGVLAVGGQTQTPAVGRCLQERFHELLVDLDPLTATVEGAAWAAEQLESTAPINLHEPLYGALGYGARGGRVQPILPMGTILPSAGRMHYVAERAEDLHIYLFQGDRGHVERDEPVAHLLLSPPEPVEWPWQVLVDVEVSPMGGLAYSAQDADSGAPVAVREIFEVSREQLRAHFGQGPTLPVPTPPTGLFGRLMRTFKPGDEPYN